MNKRGVSSIVVTVLIIFLVFAVVSVLWVAISKIAQRGAAEIELNQRCLEVNIMATALKNITDTNYSITLKRSPSGEEVEGVKLLFFNPDDETSEIIDLPEKISPLETLTRSIETKITNINKVELTPYFKDESDNELICPTTASYEF